MTDMADITALIHRRRVAAQELAGYLHAMDRMGYLDGLPAIHLAELRAYVTRAREGLPDRVEL